MDYRHHHRRQPRSLAERGGAGNVVPFRAEMTEGIAKRKGGQFIGYHNHHRRYRQCHHRNNNSEQWADIVI